MMIVAYLPQVIWVLTNNINAAIAIIDSLEAVKGINEHALANQRKALKTGVQN